MMNAAREILTDGELRGGVGKIVATTGGACVVEHQTGRSEAKRARSCLLAPQLGDHVLFAGEVGGSLYVLSVLEREESQTEIAVEDELVLRGGACRIRTPGDLELRAGSKVSVASSQVEVRAHRADAYFDHLGVIGRRVVTEVERVRTVVAHVDRLLGSVRERVQNAYRTVEEMEHVRAGTVDIAAEGMARVHGRHTLVGGDELVKVNGAQVHLG